MVIVVSLRPRDPLRRHDEQRGRVMLNESEKALLRDAEPAALAKLDEDGLLVLHDRVRRVRTKYSKLYRRRAAGQVGSDAARGRAHATHARTATKAEAFEDALARVSATSPRQPRRVPTRSRRSAWPPPAGARGHRRGPASRATGATAKGAASAAKVKRRTPASKRSSATARASTRRVEAARASAEHRTVRVRTAPRCGRRRRLALGATRPSRRPPRWESSRPSRGRRRAQRTTPSRPGSPSGRAAGGSR